MIWFILLLLMLINLTNLVIPLKIIGFLTAAQNKYHSFAFTT